MFRLTSGKQNFQIVSQTVFFFGLSFLLNCVKLFSKTCKRPVKFFNFMRYLCVSNVSLMLGKT